MKDLGSGNLSKDTLLSFQEVRQRLNVSLEMFDAIVLSGLLGPMDEQKQGVPLVGVEHFERYGTQWRDDIGERSIPYELLYESPEFSGMFADDISPLSTHTSIYITPAWVPNNTPHDPAKDTGWIAHFYLKPNRYFFSPLMLTSVGSPALKLTSVKKVQGTYLKTYLCPDPANSLAMIRVDGNPKPPGDSFEVAFDVVSPLLDELSATYNKPLPIAQTCIVGIPSGIIQVFSPWGEKPVSIDNSVILPRCPYPELLDAVALYRESICCPNPFHQFLTFWKVCEIYDDFRNKYKTQNKRDYEGSSPEKFPESYYEPSFRGKTFQYIRKHDPEHNWKKLYRNVIAHGYHKKNERKPRTAASSKEFVEVSTAVPIMRYMAYNALQNLREAFACKSSLNNINGQDKN